MDVNEFKDSLKADQLPAVLSIHLKALWFDAKGDWSRAHELIQDEEDSGSASIHAYLHRKEGDDWNADYWYRRAGIRRFNGSLEDEWKMLVTTFVS